MEHERPMRRTPIYRAIVAIALTFFCLGQGGCASVVLSNMAVKAPNQQRQPRVVRNPAYAQRFDQTYAQAWKVRVGPPAAELSVAVIEPADYRFSHKVVLQMDAKGRKRLTPQMDWTPVDFTTSAGGDERRVIKGTVLVLHGYMDTKENMIHWALCLAELGFRAVLVDLRGHGRSTDDVIGYGAFEARDLSQVIDELYQRDLIAGRLGVIGVSYGASTGLLLAARDQRVATVVALEPFSNAEKVVVEFAHGVAPKRAAKISDRTFVAAVARAPKAGGFSWRDTDVLAAVKQLKVPVLFYHGAKDRWISPEHSRLLANVAPEGSRLQILENDDHLLLSMRLAPIANDVIAWFNTHLAAPPDRALEIHEQRIGVLGAGAAVQPPDICRRSSSGSSGRTSGWSSARRIKSASSFFRFESRRLGSLHAKILPATRSRNDATRASHPSTFAGTAAARNG